MARVLRLAPWKQPEARVARTVRGPKEDDGGTYSCPTIDLAHLDCRRELLLPVATKLPRMAVDAAIAGWNAYRAV